MIYIWRLLQKLKAMKKLIVSISVIFIFFFISDLYSQSVIKFRAKYTAYCEKKYYGWSDWTDWIETNYLITIDLQDERVTLFADDALNFDVIDYEVEKDNDDETLIIFKAIDDEGYRCQIRFKYDSWYDYRQLYIDYPNFIVVYSLKPMFR
jgi:hypothetical protein